MSTEARSPSPHVSPRPQTGTRPGASPSGWWDELLPPVQEGETPWGVSARDRWVLTWLLVPMAVMIALHGWRWTETERSTVSVARAVPIVEPRVETPNASPTPQPAAYVFQVDVNAATWIEWAQLDGIGEKLAKRIVADRADHGPFQSVEDLRRVKGIGAKTLDKMRPHLTFAAAE